MVTLPHINLQHFFCTIASGPVDTVGVSTCIKQESGYVIYPGIVDYPSEVRFKTKHLHEWGSHLIALIRTIVKYGMSPITTNSYHPVHYTMHADHVSNCTMTYSS